MKGPVQSSAVWVLRLCMLSYHHHQAVSSRTNLKSNHHCKQSSTPGAAGACWSTATIPGVSRLWRSESDCQGQRNDDSDDGDAAAAECADSEGCWLAGVCVLQRSGTLGRLVMACHGVYHVWPSVVHVWALFLPFMSSLIRCRSESCLWFMSESCSPRCCSRGTLTRESY